LACGFCDCDSWWFLLWMIFPVFGYAAVRVTEDWEDHLEQEPPTVTVAEAARQLGLSERQTRRRAPQLGGKRIGGVWLIDQDAIAEHKEGQKWTEAT